MILSRCVSLPFLFLCGLYSCLCVCEQTLFTFPQSVGIAGGRPSSSYYFVGYQAEQLFYLDPHHTRPCIPLQPVSDLNLSSQSTRSSTHRTSSSIEPTEVNATRLTSNRRGARRMKRKDDIDASNWPDSSSSSPA